MPFSRYTRVYTPETLEMLYRAFNTAFHLLSQERPQLDHTEQQHLRERLAQIIIDVYLEGEKDPESLARNALERLAS